MKRCSRGEDRSSFMTRGVSEAGGGGEVELEGAFCEVAVLDSESVEVEGAGWARGRV